MPKMPDRSKFQIKRPNIQLPDTSKFQLKRPNIQFPDRSKFHLKRANANLQASIHRVRRSISETIDIVIDPHQAESPQPTTTPKGRSIFDFSTFPRRPKIFQKKFTKQTSGAEETEPAQSPYSMTSTPKDARARSVETSTLPTAKKKGSFSLTSRWAQRFDETAKEPGDKKGHVLEQAAPWRHTSNEAPCFVTLVGQGSSEEEAERIPWEKQRKHLEELGVEQSHSGAVSRVSSAATFPKEEEGRQATVDPKLRDEEMMARITVTDETIKSTQFDVGEFRPVDPRDFGLRPAEMSDDESMRSDKEVHQSSGSSREQRRIEIIEALEKEAAAKPKSKIEIMGRKFFNDIQEVLKNTKFKKHKPMDSEPVVVIEVERFSTLPPPKKPARSRVSMHRSQESISPSTETHRVVYQTESSTENAKVELDEPFDNIVVVKPARRKSKEQRASVPLDENVLQAAINQHEAPPVPSRRKRHRERDKQSSSLRLRFF